MGEKSLEMRHFRDLPCPEEAEMAPSWAGGVAQDRKDFKKRLSRRQQGVQSGAVRKPKWEHWSTAPNRDLRTIVTNERDSW